MESSFFLQMKIETKLISSSGQSRKICFSNDSWVRVTRLDEFSPNGRLFTYNSRPNVGTTFAHEKVSALILTNNGLGYILGACFTNSSSHPARGSICFAFRMFVCLFTSCLLSTWAIIVSVAHTFKPGLPGFYWSKHTKTGKIYQMTIQYTKRL
jgi:hypothetical protein